MNGGGDLDNGTEISGATDGTRIGNDGDRLKVSTTLSPASTNASVDAFGRFRVSSPLTIFDATFPVDKNVLTFVEKTASGGTVTHDSDRQSVQLACTTTGGSSAIFQSRIYHKYRPGKSQLVIMTGNMGGGVASVVKRWGVFDVNNGMFFELNGTTARVVVRSKATGSIVDTAVAQSAWNIDKMDGTGVSGLTLDFAKQNIYVIDYQWLGSGRVRYGVEIGGVLYYVHEALHANILERIYSQYGTYPVRCEIVGSGAAGSMYFTCCSITSEGGDEADGIFRTVNSGLTAKSYGASGSVVPLISLRKNSANVTVPIRLLDFQTFSSSADDMLITIYLNTALTGASWDAAPAGFAEYDISATAISGGIKLYSHYVRGASQIGATEITAALARSKSFALGADVDMNSDVLTIVGQNITTNASLYGAINYREII